MKRKINTKIKRRDKKQEYDLDGIPSSSRKMKCFKKRRQQNRIRTTIFQMHSLLKFCSIIAMLWLCSRLMICKYWYLPQNTFDAYPNNHIRIIGNKITPNDKIIAALKRHPIPKKPIYLVNTTPYEDEIEKLSPVKKAFVRRYWLPTRFEVTIEEEIPVITISPSPTAPEIAALTSKGRVIDKEYLPIDHKKYNTFKILTYDDFNEWTSEEIYHLSVLAQRIEDYSGENLVYLDIRNKNDVFAQIETIKIRIGELNSTLKERIERLSSVIPQIRDLNLERQTEYVDLRWDNTTYLKKKSKTSAITEPKPPEDYKQNAEEKKAEHSVSENKKQDAAKHQDKKESLKPEKPQPKQETKPSQKPAAQTKPTSQKQAEPKPLPNIDIQIVEP
ncbi:MAG: FtsQ-type POTRA domain-containing protein [bacterium]|nr:FtsQ-type POTRA domain-containing protein [bacterium]